MLTEQHRQSSTGRPTNASGLTDHSGQPASGAGGFFARRTCSHPGRTNIAGGTDIEDKEGESASEDALAGLMQSRLLKRFESSWHPALKTVNRMRDANYVMLRAIRKREEEEETCPVQADTPAWGTAGHGHGPNGDDAKT